MTHADTVAPAWLMLEDGLLFKGRAYGARGTTGGEICFNTGMTGYQEVFTDPSYTGQILVMNAAYTGNYGVNELDTESEGVKIKGLVARNISTKFSRMLASGSLDAYFGRNGILAISDIDTRAIVHHIRDHGAMNCVISTELDTAELLKQALKEIPDMNGLELSSVITTPVPYTLGNPGAATRVAVLDFGVKRNILHSIAERDSYVKVFPARTSLADLEEFKADGYFLSNGPGDPAAMDYAVATVRQLLAEGKPLFGICLGHQLLARACGIPTYKMHHGHRGLNHPVKNKLTGRSEITTQNHGFCVDGESLSRHTEVEETHVNLNDGTVEGFRFVNRPVFSVQYHPESTPGPHDARYLFDQFRQYLK